VWLKARLKMAGRSYVEKMVAKREERRDPLEALMHNAMCSSRCKVTVSLSTWREEILWRR
jgi:hypothetical protein